MKDRRLRSGYSNFGGIRITVIPFPVILSDRTTGQQWLVSWSTNSSSVDGYGYLSVNSDVNIEQSYGVRVFAPLEGPVLLGSDGEYTLMVRNGILGFDFMPFAQGIRGKSNAPVYLRKKGNLEIRQLVPKFIGVKIYPTMTVGEGQING